jgi:hypothetical protein
MQGRLYDEIRLDDMTMRLPRPFMFSLTPQPHHPWYGDNKNALAQTLVLYDNAGEHFQPGMDSATNPGTQHLARASGIFFLFDPTKDARFRARCESDDPQLSRRSGVERQEILLTESMSRLQRYAPQWRTKKYDRPLVVIVTKFDIWRSLLKHPLGRPWGRSPGAVTASLDMDRIMKTSFEVRYLLKELCPEFVATAESFASKVIYVPVSALGHSPSSDPKNPASGLLLVRPRDIKPKWAVVPMLYMLARFGMIRAVRRRLKNRMPPATSFQLSGDRMMLTVPGTKQKLEVPSAYWGCILRCPETGTLFRVPDAEAAGRGSDGTERAGN